MDLKKLKERNAANITSIALSGGDVVHLRKLTAASGRSVGKALIAMGHSDPESPAPDEQQMFDMHILLLSKTMCDEHGVLVLDTDEGRDELRNLSLEDAKALADKAQEWSGLFTTEPAKKN